MSPRLALYFLGSPQLYLDEKSIPAGRRKTVAMLAYLAVCWGKHRRESLSALFWPDYDQSKAFTNLRHTLWEIQQSIGKDWLTIDREKIGLDEVADIWLDIRQFKSLLTQEEAQTDPSHRIPLLEDSVKLYRDHFLTGFSLRDAPNFNEWAFDEAESLRHQFSEALIRLSETYCALGQAEKAVPSVRRLITLDPLNESAHRRLMEIYLRAGRHSAALKQYQICEKILRNELNLDPQPETYALYKQIRKREMKNVQTEKTEEIVALNNELALRPMPSYIREKQQGKMEIRNKTEHDPASDLYLPDAWMRWALLAVEEIIGKLGVRVVLKKAGLEHLIGNYPAYEQPRPSKKFTFADYATLNASLIDFCGREAEAQVIRMGRAMIRHSTMEQGTLYGIGTVSFPKFLSFPAQLKMGLDVIQEAAWKASQSIGQDHHISVEDRGDKLAYINQECAMCAGKESNRPICMRLTGNLQEALRWLTGNEVHVEEVECRAMGAEACVWEIHKQPKL